MRNFLTLDVKAPEDGRILLPVDAVLTGMGGVCQGGRKLNCLGDCSASFAVKTKELPKNPVLLFETSARETFSRDLGEQNGDAADADYMLGYKVDRGANRNCFFMTTKGKEYASKLTVEVNGETIGAFVLEDDPADSRGCLSWHYQESPKKLDEAGTYGYLCRVPVPERLLKEDEVIITFRSDNGFSLFGRESGRYPTGLRVIGG